MDEKYDLWYYSHNNKKWILMYKSLDFNLMDHRIKKVLRIYRESNLKRAILKVCLSDDKTWIKNIPSYLLK